MIFAFSERDHFYFALRKLLCYQPQQFVSADRFNAVPLLQQFFVCTSVFASCAVVSSCLFLISSSFGASGRLCFVTVAFPW